MPQVFRKNNLRSGRLQVHLFGDWDKTIRILNKLSPQIKTQSLRAQMKICLEVKDRVQKHIQNQDLGWTSLSSKYQKRKQKKGLDERTLISWGEYYYAIDAWTIGNQHLAMVGVRTGIYTKTLSGKRNKMEVARIAALHEFARGGKLPRRPLWNPTIAEMGGKRGFMDLYKTTLLNLLRRNGIPIKEIRGYF